MIYFLYLVLNISAFFFTIRENKSPIGFKNPRAVFFGGSHFLARKFRHFVQRDSPSFPQQIAINLGRVQLNLPQAEPFT